MTLRICGNLQIEEGLHDCFGYLSQHVPGNAIYLKRHGYELGAMRVLARADATHGERMDRPVPYTDAAKAAMVGLATDWQAGELPGVLVINKPREEPVTRCMLEALGEPSLSAMSLPLIIGDQIVGALALIAGVTVLASRHDHLPAALAQSR